VGSFLKPGATSVWRILFSLHEIVIHIFKKAHILFCLPCSRYTLGFFLVWRVGRINSWAPGRRSGWPPSQWAWWPVKKRQSYYSFPKWHNKWNIKIYTYLVLLCGGKPVQFLLFIYMCIAINLIINICVLPSIWLKTYVYCHQSDLKHTCISYLLPLPPFTYMPCPIFGYLWHINFYSSVRDLHEYCKN
jgi:hypothetical protein